MAIRQVTSRSIKDGEIVDKHVGSASKTQLEDKLKSLI